LILIGAWLIASSVVLFAVLTGWRVRAAAAATPSPEPVVSRVVTTPLAVEAQPVDMELPSLTLGGAIGSISRRAMLHTIIPTRPRQEAADYTVSMGDSVFGIAQKFNIKPETVLWANYGLLNDNPDMISLGMVLKVPPVDGVYYQWQEGDTLEAVAAKFDAKAEDIVNWIGNQLDLTNPQVQAESWVMIPGGHREFKQWIVPVIPRGKAGVSKSVYGPGACEGSYEGAVGGGFFAWPTASHVLSGNDYWSGHLGIDIAGGVGDSVYAADGGVVVFAGWSTGGYGYMIMIDHGTGYQTLYGHLSRVTAYCGQSVYQGSYIGALGSTGNSTGPHLHFEVRYLGGFVNPWYVLPPP
jgi:murein DD-endopeptidase MepM/ murein hydrolase activator NlpD